MMGANIHTVITDRLESQIACVRVSLERGLPSFRVINFSGADSQRVRDIVLSQFKRNRIKLPAMKIKVEVGNDRLVPNGTKYTFPIALAVLRGIQNRDIGNEYAYGNISINGELLETPGEFQYQKATQNIKGKVIHRKSSANSKYSISNFDQLLTDHLEASKLSSINKSQLNLEQHFKDILGQLHIKRALQIAIAGNHSIYISGSIGTGKSELIKAVQKAYIPKDFEGEREYISAFGNKIKDLTVTPATTKASLIGSRGVIYKTDQTVVHFEEFPEMSKSLIHIAKQLLEKKSTNNIPIKPLLCFTSNLCPCGLTGQDNKKCSCTEYQRDAFKRKIPNNIKNRIDIHVTTYDLNEKANTANKIYSKAIHEAWQLQTKRFNSQSNFNSDIKINEINKYLAIPDKQKQYLIKAITNLNLNRRDYTIILKLARTIADLENSPKVKREHLIEALSYRPKFG